MALHAYRFLPSVFLLADADPIRSNHPSNDERPRGFPDGPRSAPDRMSGSKMESHRLDDRRGAARPPRAPVIRLLYPPPTACLAVYILLILLTLRAIAVD